MNETFGSKSTIATIGGAKETLVFGARYDVRYGDDDVLRDAILHERAANGDLVFLVAPDGEGANGGRKRVRPSTIDAIVLRTPPRAADESADAYLSRLERDLGVGYTGWIATDAGQSALEAAAAEDRASRNGKGSKPERVAAILPTVVADLPTPKLTKAGVIDAGRPKGRPYAERNQAWRCGTCKKRTRQATCANGHPPVAAPALAFASA